MGMSKANLVGAMPRALKRIDSNLLSRITTRSPSRNMIVIDDTFTFAAFGECSGASQHTCSGWRIYGSTSVVRPSSLACFAISLGQSILSKWLSGITHCNTWDRDSTLLQPALQNRIREGWVENHNKVGCSCA